jgi:hypothetical protein
MRSGHVSEKSLDGLRHCRQRSLGGEWEWWDKNQGMGAKLAHQPALRLRFHLAKIAWQAHCSRLSIVVEPGLHAMVRQPHQRMILMIVGSCSYCSEGAGVYPDQTP